MTLKNLSETELNTIQDLIILIKIEPQHEYIYDLIEMLDLNANVIDSKTRRTEHALTLDSELRGNRHALKFINELDKIWSGE